MKYEELTEIVQAPSALLTMKKEELKSLLGKDFSVMQGFSQNNPHHCYDLLEHTVRTIEALDCSKLEYQDCTQLKIAALFHDTGKPGVAFEKNDRTVFYNHAAESVKIARRQLRKSGLSADAVNRILFFIEYHDTFISFRLADEIKEDSNPSVIPIEKKTVGKRISSIKKTCQKKSAFIPSQRDFTLLMSLCLADAAAQSEQVMYDGILIDSRSSKIRRIETIQSIIEDGGY